MVRKGDIAQNLKEIETLYNGSKSNKKKFYFAKLAVLELCGWLEDAMDKVVLESAIRCISEAANRKSVEEKIDRTFGFAYEKHFRPLLTYIVGMSRLEKVESEFDKVGALSKFRSTLTKLKDPRNIAAHTHSAGVLPNIDAPSVVRQDLELLYRSLRQLDRLLKRMRY
jgi:2-iminobutanoate/2-iminopropanoate deaminase